MLRRDDTFSFQHIVGLWASSAQFMSHRAMLNQLATGSISRSTDDFNNKNIHVFLSASELNVKQLPFPAPQMKKKKKRSKMSPWRTATHALHSTPLK